MNDSDPLTRLVAGVFLFLDRLMGLDPDNGCPECHKFIGHEPDCQYDRAD